MINRFTAYLSIFAFAFPWFHQRFLNKKTIIKKVYWKEFENTQANKLINILDKALEKLDMLGEIESKNYIKAFKGELKTKTKNLYMNRSKITLFDYSLYDYLDELTSIILRHTLTES